MTTRGSYCTICVSRTIQLEVRNEIYMFLPYMLLSYIMDQCENFSTDVSRKTQRPSFAGY